MKYLKKLFENKVESSYTKEDIDLLFVILCEDVFDDVGIEKDEIEICLIEDGIHPNSFIHNYSELNDSMLLYKDYIKISIPFLYDTSDNLEIVELCDSYIEYLNKVKIFSSKIENFGFEISTEDLFFDYDMDCLIMGISKI